MSIFTGAAGWASPFGIGFFLISLGLFIFLLGRADPARGGEKKKKADE
ncbi:MAG: hypothetical protein LAT65_14740 [Saccharospirillum sp.]|nr:hypothetical protein [Saccharospirillum sp.]